MLIVQEVLFLAGWLLLRIGLPLLVLIIIGTFVQRAYEADAQRDRRHMA